jgi:hypothetical protein
MTEREHCIRKVDDKKGGLFHPPHIFTDKKSVMFCGELPIDLPEVVTRKGLAERAYIRTGKRGKQGRLFLTIRGFAWEGVVG